MRLLKVLGGKVIAITNQKRGVGKTTTFSLGVALAQRGYKVLLVDGDAPYVSKFKKL